MLIYWSLKKEIMFITVVKIVERNVVVKRSSGGVSPPPNLFHDLISLG